MSGILSYNGFILDGTFIDTNNGCHRYQTSVGVIAFTSIKSPSKTRIYVDSRNMIFHENFANNLIEARLNSIENDVKFYYRLSLTIGGEDFSLRILNDQLASININPQKLVFIEIRYADIL